MENKLYQFYVDLGPYTGEELEKRTDLLDHYAYIASPVLSKPKFFRVFWNESASIEEILNIPSNLIHPQR